MSAIRTRLVFVIAGILLVGVAVQGGAFKPNSATAAADPTSCIKALRDDRAEAFRIIGEQNDEFNAAASDSKLGKAHAAYVRALRDAQADFFKAYQYAYQGQKTTANSWVKKGNAAVAISNAQGRIYNAEIDKLNATTVQIDADQNALGTKADATDATCQGF